jgi:large subunit ribosomal protein L29
MNATEVKGLTDQQLAEKLAVRERDLVTARFQKAKNQLENTASLATIRKDIARIKSEARVREQVQKLGKGDLLAKQAKGVAKPGAAPAAANAEKGGFLKGIVDKLTAKE